MCDTLVAVGDATASGVTLFGKNSDRHRGECQPLLQFAEANHPEKSRVRCTHIEIPQVAETYRVLGHSPWWVWGFEHGANEHAVAVGNLTVFSNEPVEEAPGLIGMDLVRLALERGRSAREALEVIATLIESHGQGGSANAPGADGYHNAFLLADAEEAWILETSNRRWAAQRARLDSCSNQYSLGDDWEIGSRDFESFARGQGWWRNHGRVNVAGAYRNRAVPASISEQRYRRSQQLLELGRGRHDVASFRTMLRDHGEGGAVWSPSGDAARDFCSTLCAHSEPISWTTASLIAALPQEPEQPWPVWVSFGTPCTGIFLPVYVAGVIPAPLARGGECETEESAWWAFEHLDAAAAEDSAHATPSLRAGWVELEARIEAERVQAESDARDEFARGRKQRAAEILTEFMDRSVAAALGRSRELLAQLRSAA
jgi:dipeptidase